MNTQFEIANRTLSLARYPKQWQHPSWQAWDSADELIIEHVTAQQTLHTDSRMLILNDDFGALSCFFADAHIVNVSDSYVAQTSCKLNRSHNELGQDAITYQDSLHELPTDTDWVLIKIPKTVALLEQQLIQLQKVITPNSKIVAGAKAKSIQKTTLKLFEKYLGTTTTSLAKKKSRLIFVEPDTSLAQFSSPYPTVWKTDDGRFTLSNHANVFSRAQLDLGARFFLQHLPNCRDKTVVDLGCGNGIVGLTVLDETPDCTVIFIDESYMAIASAKQSVANNRPDLLDRCQFVVSNCMDQLDPQTRVDVILCNPPFHQQNVITDHIATQMFTDAKEHLNSGGELRIIGNRHLEYSSTLKRLFGGFQVVASDKRFTILSSMK